MENSISNALLEKQIEELERKQARELRELKEQFKTTYTALKPANLVKSTFNEVVHTPGFEDQFISTITGLVTGYVAKKLTVGKSDSVVKKLVGDLLQLGITTGITRHPQQLKAVIDMVGHFLKPHPKATGAKYGSPPNTEGLSEKQVLMKHIMDLMSTVKENHPRMYQDLIIVPLPERDYNNHVTVAALKSYSNKLKQAVLQYEEKNNAPKA